MTEREEILSRERDAIARSVQVDWILRSLRDWFTACHASGRVDDVDEVVAEIATLRTRVEEWEQVGHEALRELLRVSPSLAAPKIRDLLAAAPPTSEGEERI